MSTANGSKNQQLFNIFYATQAQKIKAFLIARMGHETGKDMFQDVMLAVLQKGHSIDNLEGYAWITAKNAINKHFRHNVTVEEYQKEIQFKPTPNTVIDQQEVSVRNILEYVERVLESSTGIENSVFKMYFSEEFTLKEISEHLDIPLSTVSYIKNSIQEKIGKLIKQDSR